MRSLMVVLVLVGSLFAPLRAAELPTETGQAAFAALAEMASRLRADPKTEWEQVDLLALREHLVDMSEVTLRAAVTEEELSNGVRMRVTGEGRTLDALRRMIPMHSRMLGGVSWKVEATPVDDGYLIDVTSDDAAEADRVRGLGFFGFLAAGNHHRRHHLGIASGTMRHHAHHGASEHSVR